MAFVRAKTSPPNGAFASLAEICLVTLSVKSTQSRRDGPEPYGLDPWLGDLKQVCEEANVKIHTKARTTSREGPSGEFYPCSSCRIGEVDSLDSAPVIP